MFEGLSFLSAKLKKQLKRDGYETLKDIAGEGVTVLPDAYKDDVGFQLLFVYAFIVCRLGGSGDGAEHLVTSRKKDIQQTDFSHAEAVAASFFYEDSIDRYLQDILSKEIIAFQEKQAFPTVLHLIYADDAQLSGRKPKAFKTFQKKARLILEANIQPEFAEAIFSAKVKVTAEELRDMEPTDYAQLVQHLRLENYVGHNAVIYHPGRFYPPAYEMATAPSVTDTEYDIHGNLSLLKGQGYPGALLRLEEIAQNWRFEQTADENGLFSFDVSELPQGQWQFSLTQKPERAVAFSHAAPLVDIVVDYPELKIKSMSPKNKATDVSVTSDIVLTFPETIKEESFLRSKIYVTGEKSGHVPADVDFDGNKTITLRPRTVLQGMEKYTLVLGGLQDVTGARFQEIAQNLAVFTTGKASVIEAVKLDQAGVVASEGWAGRPTKVTVTGVNIPHGAAFSFGALEVYDHQWRDAETIDLWVIANHTGEHEFIISLPDGPVRTGAVLQVYPPSVTDFVFGNHVEAGPADGDVHVFVPSAAEIQAPQLLLGDDIDGLAPSETRYHQEGVFHLIFQVPREMRDGIDEDADIQLCYTDKFVKEFVREQEAFDERAEQEILEEDESDAEPLVLIDGKELRTDIFIEQADPFLAVPPEENVIEEKMPRRKKDKPDPDKKGGVADLKGCRPCGLSSPDTTPEICVGDKINLVLNVCVDEETLLTVDHQFGGRGAANGGWSSRRGPDSNPNIRIPVTAIQAGVVDIQAKLWCKGRSKYVFFKVKIKDCKNNAGPGGGGGGFPPPPPPGGGGGPGGGPGGGGGGAGGSGTAVVGGGRIDFCGSLPVFPGTPFHLSDTLRGQFGATHTTYRFGGVKGDYVSFKSFPGVGGTAGSSFVNFTLFDENQNFLTGGTRILGPGYADQGTVISGFPLPEDGIYYLTVCKDPLRAGGNGFVIETEIAPKQKIKYGDSVNGTVTYPQEGVLYSFDGEKGEFIDLSILGVGQGFIPFFRVFDPDGLPLISPETLRQRENYQGLYLPKDGEYTIRVAVIDLLMSSWQGGFTLTLNETPVTDILRSNGAVFSGSLGNQFDVRVFRFNRAEFDMWYVNFDAFGGPPSLLPFRPRVEMIDPDGDTILNRQTNIDENDFALTKDGDYFVRVFIQLNDNGQGDYTASAGSFNGAFSFEQDSNGDGIPDHITLLPPSLRPSAPGNPPPSPTPPMPMPGPGGGGPLPPLPPPGGGSGGGAGSGSGGGSGSGSGPIAQPGVVKCSDPLAIVVGYEEGEPGDIFVAGDEIHAIAVPDYMKRPGSNLAAAWTYNPPTDHEYTWYADVRFVDGRMETYVLDKDIPEIGIKFIEQDKNKLEYKVETPDEIACVDLRVVCFTEVDDITGLSGLDGAFDRGSYEGEFFPEQAYEAVGSDMPCHIITLWPDAQTLKLYQLRQNVTPLPPRNYPVAEAVQGVYVSNGTFFLPQTDYTMPNYNVPLLFERRFYGMIDYPNSMVGKGWLFKYDIRVSRTSDHSVEVRNAAGDARIANFKYKKERANVPVAVKELNGKPGAGVYDEYDAVVDYYSNDSEFAEVLYIRKQKPQYADEMEEMEDFVVPSVADTTAGSFASMATSSVALSTATTTSTTTTTTGSTTGSTTTGGGITLGPTRPRERPPEEEIPFDDPDCEAFYLQRFKDGTRYKYDCFGRLVWIRDRHRNCLEFEYNNANHPFQPTDIRQTNSSKVSVLEYEEIEGAYRLKKATSPATDVFEYTYDSDQIKEVSFPIANKMGEDERVSYKYDYDGEQLSALTAPRGYKVLENTYAGHVLKTQTSGGGTWAFDFGAKLVTTPRGAKIEYKLDNDKMRIISRSYLNGVGSSSALGLSSPYPHTKSWAFNEHSQHTKIREENGIVTDFIYEDKNKAMELSGERFEDDVSISFKNNLAIGNPLNRIITSSKKSSDIRVWEFKYDEQLNFVTETKGPQGLTTKMEYKNGDDGYNGNPYKIIKPKVTSGTGGRSYGRTEIFDYNVNGQILTHDDGAGLVTENQYQSDGQLNHAILDAGGLAITTSTAYNDRGHLEEMYEPDKGRTVYEVDPRGAVLEERNALGHEIKYQYDDNGNLLKRFYKQEDNFVGRGIPLVSSRARPENDIVDAYRYDSRDRRTHEIMDSTLEYLDTRFEYDVDGRADYVCAPLGGAHKTGYEYNERGQVVTVTSGVGGPDEVSEYNIYDQAGHRIAHINKMGHVTRYNIDGFGRVEEIIHPNGTKKKMTYSVAGKITQIEMIGSAGPLLNNQEVVLERKEFAFDEWGRNYMMVQDILDPGGDDTGRKLRVIKEYNAAGLVVKETTKGEHGRGMYRPTPDKVITYQYDSARRLISREDDLGNKAVMTYKSDSNLVETRTDTETNTQDGSKSSVTTRYRYDAIGNMLSLTAGAKTTLFYYDSLGNQRLVVEPDGRRREMRYDTVGRLVKTYQRYEEFDIDTYAGTFGDRVASSRRGVSVETTEYDKNSQTVAKYAANGSVYYKYDTLGRMTSVTENQGRRYEAEYKYSYDAGGRPDRIIDPNGTAINNLYDTMGNLVSRRIQHGRNVGGTELETYYYDGLSRPVYLQDSQNETAVIHAYDSLGRTRAERNVYFDNRALPQLRVLNDYTVVSKFDGRGNRIKAECPQHSFNSYRDSTGRIREIAVGAEFNPFYEPARFSFDYWGTGLRQSRMRGTEGADYTVRFDYTPEQVLFKTSMRSDEPLFPWSYQKRFELDDMARITKSVIVDGRFRGDGHPYQRNEDRFEYDVQGQLIRSMRGIENGQYTKGWSVSTYDQDKTPDANVSIMRDPYLTNWDAYKWAILDSVTSPFVPLTSTALGIEWGEPNYYLRTEERYDKRRNGQITGKTTEFERINQTPSLMRSLFGRTRSFLDMQEVDYIYDKNGNLRKIRADMPVKDNDGNIAKERRTIKEYLYDYKNRLIEARDFVKMGHFNIPRYQPMSSYRALYSYDVSNRLVQVTIDNRSLRKPTSYSRFMRWDGEQVIEEMERVADNLPLRTTGRYVWGPKKTDLLAFDKRTRDEAKQGKDYHRFYPVSGADGRAEVLLNRQSRVVEVYGETDKGARKVFSLMEVKNKQLQEKTRFTFDDGKLEKEYIYDTSPIGYQVTSGGHLIDDISGMIYMRSRWYSPELGRFASRDPAAIFGPNAYTFGENNPVGNIDPNGAEPITILVAAGVGAAVSGAISWATQPYDDTDWGVVGKKALIGGVSGALSAGAGAIASAGLTGASAVAASYAAETAVDTAWDVVVNGEDATSSLVKNAIFNGIGEGIGAAISRYRKGMDVAAVGTGVTGPTANSWKQFLFSFKNPATQAFLKEEIFPRVAPLFGEFDIKELRRITQASLNESIRAKGLIGEAMSAAVIWQFLRKNIDDGLRFQQLEEGYSRLVNPDDLFKRYVDIQFNLRVTRGNVGEIQLPFNVEAKNWQPQTWDSFVNNHRQAIKDGLLAESTHMWQDHASIPVWFALQGLGKRDKEVMQIMQAHHIRLVDFTDEYWMAQLLSAFNTTPYWS